VFKVITSIAAIQAGVFDENRVVRCPGFFQIGNVTFSFPKEKNSCSYNYALQQSINTYFMDLGLKVGRDNLLATAAAFGVGEPTGIRFPAEHPGFLPSVESVLKTHGRNFGGGDVCNTSIGQGDLLCTPLQMANWMVTIATGGQVWKPRLVSAIEDRRGNIVSEFAPQQMRDLIIGRDLLAPVYKGMESVVKNGTAKGAQTPNTTVAGKTGTAQVGSKDRPRQIAWFGGFLPADNPQYAFAIMVEGDFDQDLHGGSDAAVLVPKIFAPLFEKKKEKDKPKDEKDPPARRRNTDDNGTEFIENP
jgi:penicillin-binding protein 2